MSDLFDPLLSIIIIPGAVVGLLLNLFPPQTYLIDFLEKLRRGTFYVVSLYRSMFVLCHY